MIEKQIKIINKLGLHARAAAKLVKLASSFDSEIMIHREMKSGDQKTVNGKSIMGVMMLAASKGTEITVSADGDDERPAIEQLELLIKARFEEDE
ncbi:MAG: HPr family phosphocarrier protein [Gammaproteobacteria bacterium]